MRYPITNLLILIAESLTELEVSDEKIGVEVKTVEQSMNAIGKKLDALRTEERAAIDVLQTRTQQLNNLGTQQRTLEARIKDLGGRYPSGLDTVKAQAQQVFVEAEARFNTTKAKLPLDFDKLPERNRRAAAALQQMAGEMQGVAAAENFLASEAERQKEAEEGSRSALRRSFFAEASKIVARYEAGQVFSRGLNIDWQKAPHTQTTRKLEMIAIANPRILKGMKPECLLHLRLAAQMMELWGTNTAKPWVPVSLETGHRLDIDTAARMLLFSAGHTLNMQSARDPAVDQFIKGVRVSTVGDGCPECARLAGKIFTFSDAPELPYEHCTSEKGCRCCLVPVAWSSKEGTTMEDPALYEYRLGLNSPWSVSRVELNVKGRCVATNCRPLHQRFLVPIRHGVVFLFQHSAGHWPTTLPLGYARRRSSDALGLFRVFGCLSLAKKRLQVRLSHAANGRRSGRRSPLR